MIGQFTATYLRRGKWYLGFVQEIPGVNTQGRTLAEVKRNLREALILVIETNRQIAHRSQPSRAIEEPLNVAVE